MAEPARNILGQSGASGLNGLLESPAVPSSIVSERLSKAAQPPSEKRKDELLALIHEIQALPVLDRRNPDEILGYGPDGLPH